MRNLLISLTIVLILSLCACSESENPVEMEDLSTEELEAKVVENCHILQAALEEFRIYNDGFCPLDIYTDTNSEGLTVIDLLPEGQLLENPFTMHRTEPVDTIATEPGQVGYYQGRRYSWERPLYYINGYGEHYTILELSNLQELEQEVIANCMRVRNAAEMFATLNGGVFPGNLNGTTPQGDTIIDMLPDGRRLRNPFTNNHCSEPVDGAAATSGQTGYTPVCDVGITVGYCITGNGLYGGTEIFLWWQTPSDTMVRVNGATVYCTFCTE